MTTQRLLPKHGFLFLMTTIIFLGGLFYFYRTHANSIVNGSNISNQSSGLLLYSAGGSNNFAIDFSLPTGAVSQIVSDFGNSTFQNANKELYLSPDRKLVAVTLDPVGEEVGPSTYIASVDGSQITSAYSGRFVSWAPDSSKALLYLSPMEAPWERRIYALDVQNQYYDTGLPDGTINADISPVDGSIAYSLTGAGTDASTIYVRNPQGNEKVLVKTDNSILSWIRWSPTGNKIAFLKSDLWASSGQQFAWVTNPDGTGAVNISGVNWGYPPAWSPDGSKLAFANAVGIWEYDTHAKTLNNVSNVANAAVSHPSYSGDGSTIVFSANIGGESQIWAAQAGGVVKLTSGSGEKDYPIMP